MSEIKDVKDVVSKKGRNVEGMPTECHDCEHTVKSFQKFILFPVMKLENQICFVFTRNDQ